MTHCEVTGEDLVSSKKTIDLALVSPDPSLIQVIPSDKANSSSESAKIAPSYIILFSQSLLYFPVSIKSCNILKLDLTLLCISKDFGVLC